MEVDKGFSTLYLLFGQVHSEVRITDLEGASPCAITDLEGDAPELFVGIGNIGVTSFDNQPTSQHHADNGNLIIEFSNQ